MNKNTLFLLFFISIISCKSSPSGTDDGPLESIPDESVPTVNEVIYSNMKDLYLWYKEMPEIDSVDKFESPQALLDTLIYEKNDRWSRLIDYSAFQDRVENAVYGGHGFGYKFDNEGDLRIAFVFDDGPFGKQGVKRGWKVLEINNRNIHSISDDEWGDILGEDIVGVTNTFLFEDSDGVEQRITSTKDIVTINTVLHYDTLSTNNTKIGYLALRSFLEPSVEELDNVFTFFAAEKIKKLILDLRYNGGGSISVAHHLANLISRPEHSGESIIKLVHNDKISSWDLTYTLESLVSSDINELIVLTTNSTASSSELIINGFKPLMKTTLIGTENTSGKYAGSYTWDIAGSNYGLSLISFFMQNKLNQNNYYEGFQPDYYTCDNLKYDFGDKNEKMLSSTLEYIDTGSISPCIEVNTKSKKLNSKIEQEVPEAFNRLFLSLDSR